MTFVIPQQDKIEIFINDSGSICISQFDNGNEEQTVSFSVEYVSAIVKELLDCKRVLILEKK